MQDFPLIVVLAALAAGFVVLFWAGDTLVNGATAMARRAGLRPLFIGLTIVAFGTSAPELMVSASAVSSGSPELALGNIVGSNIANVFLVLGLPAMFAPIAPGPKGVRRNAVIGLAAAVIFVAFAATGGLGPVHGVVLLTGIVAYLIGMWRLAQNPASEAGVQAVTPDSDDAAHLPGSWLLIWASVLAGVIGLPLGAWLIVESGVALATALAMPKALIGLTAVAIGTSLPELAATTAAALRRQTDLAIGNVLGSNIFNILAVGGVASLVGRVPTPQGFLSFDFPVMLAAAVALLAVTLVRRGVPRLVGVVFLVAYIGYILGSARIQGVL